MKINLFLSACVAMFAVLQVTAQPGTWTVNSRAEILKGDAKGVSISSEGTLVPAPEITELFKTEQPYIWSSVASPDGTAYVGTGGDGKLFRIDATGKGTLFADFAELNVSALALDKTGQLFAATSPDGRVYRVDPTGKSEVYFSPGEKYIWSLVPAADGSLIVGTGDNGKVYKVRSANAAAAASLLFDTSETHIMSLAAGQDGSVYAGTDSSGLVLKFGQDGRPFGVLDSSLREVHSLAAAADGSIYALVVGDSAAASKSTDATPSASPDNKTVSAEKPSAAVEPVRSRNDLTGAKSVIYRIFPDGSSSIVWSSTTVTGFSLSVGSDGAGKLILGTSDKGRVYEISNDGRETVLLQTGTNQISTIARSTRGMFIASSNPGTIFRIGPGTAAEGSYESSVLDAKTSSNWGRIWFEGSGDVTLQTRSGNSEAPNETWSQWSNAVRDSKGAQVTSPPARFLQWRATLRSGSAIGKLGEVNVAYIRKNIAPEVLAIQVLPTNVGLVANPPAQIDPNIEISGMDPAVFGLPNSVVSPRRVFQKGATSLQWTAEDRNADRLVYDVYYRALADTEFKLLRRGLEINFLAIDGQSLADGRYIFKIIARDDPSNPAALAFAGERSTEPVDIDNTPPVVTSAGAARSLGGTAQTVFDAVDAGSYVDRAEFSVNGGDWNKIYPDDGISDGPRERYTVTIPVTASGEYAISLRVFDANGNGGTARSVFRK